MAKNKLFKSTKSTLDLCLLVVVFTACILVFLLVLHSVGISEERLLDFMNFIIDAPEIFRHFVKHRR